MALTIQFTFVLIHSNIKYILTNNEYIKHFYFQLYCTAHLDYFTATFQDTILYIKNQLFSKQKYFKKIKKKVISPKHHNNSSNNNIYDYSSHFKFKNNA